MRRACLASRPSDFGVGSFSRANTKLESFLTNSKGVTKLEQFLTNVANVQNQVTLSVQSFVVHV